MSLKTFICPVCSEITCSIEEHVVCPACGETMIPIEGSLYTRIDNRPGSLAAFLKRLADAGINLTSLRVIGGRSGEAHVLFSVDLTEKALNVPGVRHAEDIVIFSGINCVE